MTRKRTPRRRRKISKLVVFLEANNLINQFLLRVNNSGWTLGNFLTGSPCCTSKSHLMFESVLKVNAQALKILSRVREKVLPLHAARETRPPVPIKNSAFRSV